MTDVVRTRTIGATAEDVWNVLADFGAISGWAPDVDHSCILERASEAPCAPAVGTTRRIQAGRNTVVERIVDLDPPTTLAYDIEGLHPRLRTVRNRWTLTPRGDAVAVEVTTTVDIGPHLPQRLAERAMSRILAKRSDTMLAGLATKVENTNG